MLSLLLIILCRITLSVLSIDQPPLTAEESDMSYNEIINNYNFHPSSNQFILQKLDAQSHFIITAPPPTIGEPWPKPYSFIQYNDVIIINPSVTMTTNKPLCPIIAKALERYYSRIFIKRLLLKIDSTTFKSSSASIKKINVEVKRCTTTEYPYELMNESYKITYHRSILTIQAIESWGALRGLESLAQMIYLEKNENDNDVFVMKNVEIIDFPFYAHRGLLIDTARHYISVNTLLENLDAMEMNKMNVFHWHIIDDQSFPFVSKTHPEMSEKGAFDKTSTYNSSVIRYIVQYARERGIRVIPELDMPGHTYSWGKSHPELLLRCIDSEDSKQAYSILNPILKATFDLVRDIIMDLVEIFPDKVVHLGFDEYDVGCFTTDPNIQKFMHKYTFGQYSDILAYYFKRIYKILKEYNKTITIWQEIYDELLTFLPRDVIVQVWKSEKFIDGQDEVPVASQNRFIYSKDFYLDSQIYGNKWLEFYKSRFKQGNKHDAYRGGEAAMWTEYVSDSTIIPNIWPTTCAVAELLWSSKDENYLELARRIEEQRCRMILNSIRIGTATGPGSCDYFNANPKIVRTYQEIPNLPGNEENQNQPPAKNKLIDLSKRQVVDINSMNIQQHSRPFFVESICKECRFMAFFVVGSVFGYIMHSFFNFKLLKFIILLGLCQIFTIIIFYER